MRGVVTAQGAAAVLKHFALPEDPVTAQQDIAAAVAAQRHGDASVLPGGQHQTLAPLKLTGSQPEQKTVRLWIDGTNPSPEYGGGGCRKSLQALEPSPLIDQMASRGCLEGDGPDDG